MRRGQVYRSREFNDWTCTVVGAVLGIKGGKLNVLYEYEVGAHEGEDYELDVCTLEQFHRAWEGPLA